MMDFTPFFAFLRKVFIVTGIIGAIEVITLIVIFFIQASRPYYKRNRKRSYDG